MSLLSLAGVPDLNKLAPALLAQAKDALAADGIKLEDHLMQALAPILADLLGNALKDVQAVEAPILAEIAALRKMLEGPCQAIANLGSGLQISITPRNQP